MLALVITIGLRQLPVTKSTDNQTKTLQCNESMKSITEQSESTIQKQCIKWMKFQYPFLITFAIPNGGTRNIREAVSMQQQGVMAGVSDLIILRPNKTHHALCIEFKTKNGRQSPAQKEFEKNVKQWNYQYSICRSLDEFMKVVNDYVMDI